ncbi:hypothetical protein HDU87_008652 [Geranomyces variabilis]|uniref:NlpC/P60 domain-containing protein n=1 Tax=Geranomyces variabilis TaxID=109894 RepID=A0AAD5TCT0_9FUNG|nr:hypothetical protein HDU87_008652 [Geranomyces variabilis]
MHLIKIAFTIAAIISSVSAESCSVGGKAGTCISTASCKSNGGTSTPGYCPNDPDDIRCCVPATCSADGVSGTCIATGACSASGGVSTPGLCPGGNDIQCCTKSGGGGGAGSPCGVTKSRAGIVAAALQAHNTGKTISYTQAAGPRWAGIHDGLCPNKNQLPPTADCSSFVTWIYWSAYGNGADFLNAEHWGAGYTGTLQDHGKSVSLADAQPGDLVFYPGHVAILYTKSPAQVLNYGSTGPVKVLGIDVPGQHDQIRSYL